MSHAAAWIHSQRPCAAALRPPLRRLSRFKTAAASFQVHERAENVFSELMSECGAGGSVSVADATHGHGLYLTQPATEGEVVLRVPLDSCLVVDYSGAGLRVPAGEWPRLKRAVGRDDALPWDLLEAMALLDGLSGSGDAFWARYTNAVLPQPLELPLPLCLPEDMLPELQHWPIISAALAQKQRLAELFPGLSVAMCDGGPSYLQWAFACVRSRAFRLADECFGFVPFLDVANHSLRPGCDFRLSADRQAVELVALRPLAEGEEARISYTGAAGLTNQRLMAQYGFVPAGGNPADRLTFAVLEEESSGGGAPSPVQLSIDRMQDCLGDNMAAALSGNDPYAYAALKSLPLAAEEANAAAPEAQRRLAQRLLQELQAEQAAWPTSLTQDAELAQRLQQGGTAAEGSGAVDPRMVAVVEYRVQRKALVKACAALLERFADAC